MCRALRNRSRRTSWRFASTSMASISSDDRMRSERRGVSARTGVDLPVTRSKERALRSMTCLISLRFASTSCASANSRTTLGEGDTPQGLGKVAGEPGVLGLNLPLTSLCGDMSPGNRGGNAEVDSVGEDTKTAMPWDAASTATAIGSAAHTVVTPAASTEALGTTIGVPPRPVVAEEVDCGGGPCNREREPSEEPSAAIGSMGPSPPLQLPVPKLPGRRNARAAVGTARPSELVVAGGSSDASQLRRHSGFAAEESS
mmetsp:Transcript_129530/g.415260  ORF Transcript_129530/g.415260 Transcript_129530/m.415260 type:complete len:258 (+) Transcript_129530:274-1047(+)